MRIMGCLDSSNKSKSSHVVRNLSILTSPSKTRRFRGYHELSDVLEQMRAHGKTLKEEKMVIKAYEFAKEKYKNKKRADDETPYIYHLIEVSYLVAKWSYGGAVVSAAMLHDVVEDLNVRVSEIAKVFDPHVAYLVGLLAKPRYIDGRWITAFSSKYYKGNGDRDRQLYDQKTAFYYDILFGARCLDVLSIKFADSLQNLSEIGNLPEWKRTRNIETMAKQLLEVGEKIMPQEAFEEFRALLSYWGVRVANSIQQTNEPVIVMPPRRVITRDALRTFRQPNGDHLTLYRPNGDGLYEIGLPPIVLKFDRDIRELLRLVFDDKKFTIERGKSLLPEGMTGHEVIYRIKPRGSVGKELDEIKMKLTEFFEYVLKSLLYYVYA
jgi:hypothetical protein